MINKEKRAKKMNEPFELDPYEPLPLPLEFDESNATQLSNARLSTLKQRLAQSANGNPTSMLFSSLLPLRSHLRTNYNKYCCGCDSTLVTIDSKAQTLEFPIKSLAYDKLPRFLLDSKSSTLHIILQCYNPTNRLVLIEHTIDSEYIIDASHYELPAASDKPQKFYQQINLKKAVNNQVIYHFPQLLIYLRKYVRKKLLWKPNVFGKI
jgi:hypothetical protein